MLNKELIRNKIEYIHKDLVILSDLSEYSFEDLIKNSLNYSACERILEQIVGRAIDINQHIIVNKAKIDTSAPLAYKDTFIKLIELNVYPKEFGEKISKSAGLRNMLVHEYDKIDPQIVYSSVADTLSAYTKYCEYILKYIALN